MSSGGPRPARPAGVPRGAFAAPVALVALLLAASAVLASSGVASEEAPPVHYVYSLELPTAGDVITYPQSVVADPHTGEVFVCDLRANRILIFDSRGLYRYQIQGGDAFRAPRDLALDPTGRMVVAASRGTRSALVELDFDGLPLGEVTLSGVADVLGDKLGPEGLTEPRYTSVALSKAGDRLVVLDGANHLVLIAERGGRVRQAIDLGEDLGETEARDLVIGHVDVYGGLIVVAVASEAEVWTYTLEGSPRWKSGLRGTAACQLAFPTAAALDADDNLVIIDQQRMIMLRWKPFGNKCLSEHYGFGGAPGFFYLPNDIALDTSGRAYVTQTFEGRVQVYEGLSPAEPPE